MISSEIWVTTLQVGLYEKAACFCSREIRIPYSPIWSAVDITNNLLCVPLKKGMTCTNATLILHMTPCSGDFDNTVFTNSQYKRRQ